MSATIGTMMVVPSLGAEDQDASPSGMAERSRRLQERTSGVLGEKWRDLRDSLEARGRHGESVSTASLDAREQNGRDIVRIDLPERDSENVGVALKEGRPLRILAPVVAKSGACERILVFDNLAADVKPEIVSKPGYDLIPVSLAKKSAAAPAAPESRRTPPEPLPAPPDRWDREMDEMFRESVKDFGDVPGFMDLSDRPRFDSAVELREEEGSQVVRAYLPESDADHPRWTGEGRDAHHHHPPETAGLKPPGPHGRFSPHEIVLPRSPAAAIAP
jgi:hypothetical protein